MSKKKHFNIENIKKSNPRLSRPNLDYKNKLEDLRIFQKTKTQYKKKNKLEDIEITKKDLLLFFKVSPALRSEQEIVSFANYLSQNYQYFKKLKNEDSQLKVEKLTQVCRSEKFFKGESIINYGEIGDKFYIVIEGVVEIYKPKYIEVELLPNEFINLLKKIKEVEGNILKYERIKEKNKIFFDTYSNRNKKSELNSKISNNSEVSQISEQTGSEQSGNSGIDINKLKYKQVFSMEIEEKMGEFGEGFSFGDIALIKKTVRNATIKAKENCILLTIDKNDYNKAMLEFQKKKLIKEIESFTKTYSFFKDFSNDKIINLFNCLLKKTIYKGECLYEQNKKDDCIYIINNGTFLIYCNISFCWLNDYINYISYDEKNILEFLIKNRKNKYFNLFKTIDNCNSQLPDNTISANFKKYDLWEKMDEKWKKDDLYKLKKDEEKLNDPENFYNIIIKKINYDEILGIEEIFDFKKRFCTCKCLSERAEVRYITINEFLKLILNLGEIELNYLLSFVNERKKLIRNQIFNAIKSKERKIMNNFDIRYENLIKEAENKNINQEKKDNQIFSALKIRGIKYNLQDIVDNNIPLLKEENNEDNEEIVIKMKKIKINKTPQLLLKKLSSKKKQNNQVKLKIIKNILNKRIINSLNNDKTQAYSMINIKNLSNTSKFLITKNIKHTRNSSDFIKYSKTGGASTVNHHKSKATNYSMDKIEKSDKNSTGKTPSMINFESSKIMDNSPNFNNLQVRQRIINFRNDSLNNNTRRISEYRTKDNLDYINLPNLFEARTMKRTQSDFKPILKKSIDSYNQLFQIDNYDKNVFSHFGFNKGLFDKFNSLESKKTCTSFKTIKSYK